MNSEKLRKSGKLLIKSWKNLVETGKITMTDDSSQKLCVNCKWCKKPGLFLRLFSGLEFATCEAPGNTITDLVTGNRSYRWTYCSTHRRSINDDTIIDNDCGKIGRFFEKK